MKYLVLTLVALLISGCATTHSGLKAVSKAKQEGIVISVKRSLDLSDSYYWFLEYTVENQTGFWKDVQISEIGFQNLKTEILVNDKLESWIEGAELKLKQSEYNSQVLLGSMAAVGTIGALSSNNRDLKKASVITTGVAAGTAAGISVNNALTKATGGQKGFNETVMVPKSHALTSFKVAPGSFVRRWIVIENPNNKIMASNKKMNKIKLVTKTTLKSETQTVQDEFVSEFNVYNQL